MPSLRARFVRSWVRFAVKRTLAQDPPVDRLRRKLDQLSYLRVVPRAVTREALTIEHVAAEWIVRRRIRWPVIAGAAMAGLPWLLFAWLYFGSPWPNSLVVKLAGGEAMPFDPLWVWRFTVSPGQAPTLLLAVLAAAAFTSLPAGARVAMLSLAGWCVLHAIAYSSTDLGAPYPWYLTVVPATLSVIGGSVANDLGGIIRAVVLDDHKFDINAGGDM